LHGQASGMRAARLIFVKRTGSAALLIKRRNVPERQ
jgi:hypothetical protein